MRKFCCILFILVLCASCTIETQTKANVNGNFFTVVKEEIIDINGNKRKYMLKHKEIRPLAPNEISKSYNYSYVYTKDDLFNVGDTLKLVKY